MRDELRRRREKHLLYVRMGIPFSRRCERLANEFDVRKNTVEVDDGRMDNWVDDIANTASFEDKASFLLYQHRSQTEGLEQLVRNSQSNRNDAQERVSEIQEQIESFESASPEALGYDEAANYYSQLSDLYTQLGMARERAKDWASEERLQRQQIVEEVHDEFEMRQSLGDIEKVADKLEVEQEVTSEERKVYAGLDFEEFPGIENAALVGATVDNEDAELEGGADIPVEGASDE